MPTGYGRDRISLTFLSMSSGPHQVDDFSSCLSLPLRGSRFGGRRKLVFSSGFFAYMAMHCQYQCRALLGRMEKEDAGGWRRLNNICRLMLAREMGADVIICVDLSTGWKKKEEELKSPSAVVEQLIAGMMGQTKYRKNMWLKPIFALNLLSREGSRQPVSTGNRQSDNSEGS